MAIHDPRQENASRRRRYYEANKKRLNIAACKRANVRRGKLKVWLYEYLKNNPCTDCGEADPILLEFDHIRDKLFHIGDAVRKCIPLKRVIEEVAKCQVRCCNCHRKKTYRDMGRTHRG
jgi:hypothetical protein